MVKVSEQRLSLHYWGNTELVLYLIGPVKLNLIMNWGFPILPKSFHKSSINIPSKVSTTISFKIFIRSAKKDGLENFEPCSQ